MKKRFSEAQIIGFLRKAEAGVPVKQVCRQLHGFSEASYYLWLNLVERWDPRDASIGRAERPLARVRVNRVLVDATHGRPETNGRCRRYSACTRG